MWFFPPQVDCNLLQLLNSDLSQTGQTFAGGDAYDVSPDGRMLAVQTVPGIRLLNSNTLSATDIRFQDGTPTSVSADAVITDKISWNGKYPKGEAFVTVEDQGGQRLIFHGECGSRPSFLSNSRILLMGCGDMRLLDTQGQLVTLHNWTAVMQDSLVYLKTGSGLLYTSAMKRATLLGSYTSNSSSTRRTRLCLSLWLCLRLWVSGNCGRLFLLTASTSFAEIPMG